MAVKLPALVAAAVVLLAVGVPQDAARGESVAARTYAVDSLADGLDARPGDGVCRTGGGRCTLRAAVQEAWASAGPDVVILPPGRIEMRQPYSWPLPSQTLDLEMSPAGGDLDVNAALTVVGAGAGRTTVDGNGIDRVFSVQLTGRLVLRGLTITGGDATAENRGPYDISDGGAVFNMGGLTLDRVAIVGNRADGGGGVFSTPFTFVTIRDSLIADNRAVEGGGLRIDGGALVVNTTITRNRLVYRSLPGLPDEMTGYGGGIDHRGTGNVTIRNSTITSNHALKAGGGYNSGQDYVPIELLTSIWPVRTYLSNTIVAGNTSARGSSDCHVSAMVIESRGHNLASDRSCFLGGPGDLPGRSPMLSGLGDHGGPTQTQHPRPGSPVINAGASADCPAKDQRGVRRPQGGRCDIGAVEFVAPQP